MFVCERPSLLAALDGILPLVGSNVVAAIEADESNGRLTVTVSRPGRGARGSALGRVLLGGEVRLPLAPLAKALECGVGNCRTEVCTNGTTAAVCVDPDSPHARKFTFPLGTDSYTATDWPLPPDGAPSVTIGSSAFVRLIDQGAFAATARTPWAPGWSTGSVQALTERGSLTLASTDGLRLAVAAAPAEVGGEGATFLIPLDVLRAWRKAATAAETVTLVFTPAALLFTANTVSAWTSPAPGAFPTWQTGLPALPNSVAVPTQRLTAEVKSAAAVADPDEPKIVFGFQPGRLNITATSAKAKVSLVVPLPRFKGPAAHIPLDGPRLLSVLRAYADAPVLTLHYGADSEPLAISTATGGRAELGSGGAEGGAMCYAAPMMSKTREPQRASAQK